VIMIDAQVLEKDRFMSRALRGSASLPMPLTNRASTLLLMEETFQILQRRPISAHQVGASHCRSPQRALSIVFASIRARVAFDKACNVMLRFASRLSVNRTSRSSTSAASPLRHSSLSTSICLRSHFDTCGSRCVPRTRQISGTRSSGIYATLCSVTMCLCERGYRVRCGITRVHQRTAAVTSIMS